MLLYTATSVSLINMAVSVKRIFKKCVALNMILLGFCLCKNLLSCKLDMFQCFERLIIKCGSLGSVHFLYT